MLSLGSHGRNINTKTDILECRNSSFPSNGSVVPSEVYRLSQNSCKSTVGHPHLLAFPEHWVFQRTKLNDSIAPLLTFPVPRQQTTIILVLVGLCTR